jgi:formylglycine-generating enzyme
MYKLIKYVIMIMFFGLMNQSNVFSQNGVNDIHFEYVKCGKFYRGSMSGNDDELPVRKIFIDGFLISQYEITNKQYCEFLNNCALNKDSIRMLIDFSNDSVAPANRIYSSKGEFKILPEYEDFPVCYVSWYGADLFCKFYGYRLPTEAEWEYAAKGGKSVWTLIFKSYKKYSGSNIPDNVACYRNNSRNTVMQVGSKSPNKLNLFDMSGNVDEWCNDWFDSGYYASSPNKNPLGPENAQFKVIRGGSWYNTEDKLSVTNRRASNPKNKKSTIGFRVVKMIEYML